MPEAAAFFDFDRTVLDGDAGVLFGRELVRLRRQRVRAQAPGTVGWAARNLQHETRAMKRLAHVAVLAAGNAVGVVKRSRMLREAYRALEGFPRQELHDLASDFFEDELRPRLFPEAATEMKTHHAEGRRVIVVSTGMRFLLEPIRRHLPVDDILAVDLLHQDGLLTGQVEGPLWGKDKAALARAFAHDHPLSLPRSHAYTDHYSDLALLQLVGHPHVVNPDLRLRLKAKTKDWPIPAWHATKPKPLSKPPQ